MGERAKDALFTLCISSTFLVLDYRLETDPLVTASDASKTGCGACRSTRLTPGGKTFLNKQMMDCVTDGEDILMIECFGG